MSITVRPATADRWNDLVAVFGRRGEDPSWCWCQEFVRTDTPESLGPGLRDNRTALHDEITHAGVAPGLIAYVGDDPVGWTRVGPRSAFPRVRANRALARVLTEDDVGVWWVTCFAVDCEPLGRRRVWLLAGLTNDHHTSGVAVVLPIDAATEIEELGLGYRFAVISDRHVLVAPHVVAATRRQRIETVVLTAYSYAMS